MKRPKKMDFDSVMDRTERNLRLSWWLLKYVELPLLIILLILMVILTIKRCG